MSVANAFLSGRSFPVPTSVFEVCSFQAAVSAGEVQVPTLQQAAWWRQNFFVRSWNCLDLNSGSEDYVATQSLELALVESVVEWAVGEQLEFVPAADPFDLLGQIGTVAEIELVDGAVEREANLQVSLASQ